MLTRNPFRPHTCFAADDGAGGGSTTPDGAGTTPEQTTQPGTPPVTGGDKTYTQAELDAATTVAIEERMKRETAKRNTEIEKGVQARLEDERRKAAMTEAERLQSEKAETERRATEREQQATEREQRAAVKALQADAKLLAQQCGVAAEFVSDVITLANIDASYLGDDGEPDTERLTKSINAVLEKRSFYKDNQPPPRVGGDFRGQPQDGDISNLPIDQYVIARRKQRSQRS